MMGEARVPPPLPPCSVRHPYVLPSTPSGFDTLYMVERTGIYHHRLSSKAAAVHVIGQLIPDTLLIACSGH